MRRFVVGLSILAVLTFSSAIVRGDDQQIAQHLIQKLKQQKDSGNLRGFGIDLKVERGTVLLKGHVSSAEQQRLVLEIARRIEGVKQVVNDITITSSVATPPGGSQAFRTSETTVEACAEFAQAQPSQRSSRNHPSAPSLPQRATVPTTSAYSVILVPIPHGRHHWVQTVRLR